jgi:competence protein ComGC
MLAEFFKEERAQSEWSAVYIILILAIVAVLLITIIKPMFQQSQKIVTKTKKSLSD